jgi:hypothetical protein
MYEYLDIYISDHRLISQLQLSRVRHRETHKSRWPHIESITSVYVACLVRDCCDAFAIVINGSAILARGKF